jgi:hypothetical protein
VSRDSLRMESPVRSGTKRVCFVRQHERRRAGRLIGLQLSSWTQNRCYMKTRGTVSPPRDFLMNGVCLPKSPTHLSAVSVFWGGKWTRIGRNWTAGEIVLSFGTYSREFGTSESWESGAYGLKHSNMRGLSPRWRQMKAHHRSREWRIRNSAFRPTPCARSFPRSNRRFASIRRSSRVMNRK